MARPSPRPSEFEAALAWFRARLPLTDDEAQADMDFAREQAFWVTGAAHMDLVEQVWTAIDAAIEKGETLADFQERVGAALADAWGQGDPWRLETIFRTNVQRAFGAGRHAELTEEAVLEVRPYWRAVAILDGRETEVCHSVHGTVLPADHPFWKSHWPPLHFNCRTSITALTEEQAKAKGITKHPTTEAAHEGFGTPPGEPWKPSLEGRPEPVAKAFRGKVRRRK